MLNINVCSEIGDLECVIVHTPGQEVEKMTPENAERALYSDILNLSVAKEEYSHFKKILTLKTKTLEVKTLLAEVLADQQLKENLITSICIDEGVPKLAKYLIPFEAEELASQLIEGVELRRDNLTKYLSNERYSLNPLHNFFFTRDASISIFNNILIGKMASNVRHRETVIMETIFKNHGLFKSPTVNPHVDKNGEGIANIKIEGGDVLIARDDVLIVGTGIRTSTQGIDFLIETLKSEKNGLKHLLVQELPPTPESFIHLDMVFTFLDRHYCMVYEPLIMTHNRFRTIHIEIDNGKVKSISTVPGLLQALSTLGFDLTPIKCGGNDQWHQEREQWHSGANFLALSPGVIFGYERNVYTLEELSKHGFRIIKSESIINNTTDFPKEKTVITLPGSELARGGGGARCMSMPVRRKNLNW
ncbi:MAG: arginine deiminase [Prolixibacteraceae bacterium]|nr:arginine deiminase [Prolixibacteraceae bacterium]